LALRHQRVDGRLASAAREVDAGHGVSRRAQVGLVISAQTALLEPATGAEVVCRREGRHPGRRHGCGQAVVTELVPSLDTELKLRVEHVGLEAYLHVCFASDIKATLTLCPNRDFDIREVLVNSLIVRRQHVLRTETVEFRIFSPFTSALIFLISHGYASR
jgi:hypothetical protein